MEKPRICNVAVKLYLENSKGGGPSMRPFTLVCILAAFALPAFGQDGKLNLLIQEQRVEISPIAEEPLSEKVAVRINGKLMRTFSVKNFSEPGILATFETHGYENILYRASIGSGACAGGSLFVIQLREGTDLGSFTAVRVSPELGECLGDDVLPFAVTSDRSGDVFDILGYTISLSRLDKWVKKKVKGRR